MPIMTGLEAKDEVCQLFDKFNADREQLEQRNIAGWKVSALRPFICYVSQFTEQIESFILPREEADVVLSKPIQQSEIMGILRILRVI